MNLATFKWKYRPTAETDELIRQAYRRFRSGDRYALKSASAAIGWPRGVVCKRGAELGLARTKERPWSEGELQLLKTFGHLAPSGLQSKLGEAGFRRSIAAIQVKIHRDRIKSNLEGYSACGLADAMGVDVKKILRWIRDGCLKAERRGTERVPQQGGDMWWITDRSVRGFVLRHPEEVDLAKVEKIWFLNLVTRGKLCGGNK